MTDRELLELLLKKVTGMESRIENIEQNMVTKDYIEKVVVEQQKDVIALLQHIDKKLSDKTDRIEAKLDILNDRTFEQGADIRLLQKVR